MRGIDLPGVGAVVMYDPPRSLPQYIHRVGRTARAGAVGDSYVLLSKEGPDGGFEGSDMAKFREFDALVQRNGKVDNDYRLRELHPDAVVKADGWLAAAKAALEVKGWVSAADAATAAAARTKQHQQPAHSGRPQQQQQHQQHRGSAHGAATPSRGAQQHSAQRRRPRD
jgi:superfamily II DNA/RNA helicase